MLRLLNSYLLSLLLYNVSVGAGLFGGLHFILPYPVNGEENAGQNGNFVLVYLPLAISILVVCVFGTAERGSPRSGHLNLFGGSRITVAITLGLLNTGIAAYIIRFAKSDFRFLLAITILITLIFGFVYGSFALGRMFINGIEVRLRR